MLVSTLMFVALVAIIYYLRRQSKQQQRQLLQQDIDLEERVDQLIQRVSIVYQAPDLDCCLDEFYELSNMLYESGDTFRIMLYCKLTRAFTDQYRTIREFRRAAQQVEL